MSYLARNFSHEAEVRLLRWSDGPRGATVTFELPPIEIGAGHPFKGLEGVRFRMQFDPIRDDETVAEPAKDEESRDARREAAPSTAAIDTHHAKSSDAKDRYRALGAPEQMVAKCAMTTASPTFWRFIESRGYQMPTNEEEAAQWVREKLNINSRSDLIKDEKAAGMWGQIMVEFDIYTGRLPEPR